MLKLKDLLYLNRHDRIAIVVLTSLAVLFLGVGLLFDNNKEENTRTEKERNEQAGRQNEGRNYADSYSYDIPSAKPHQRFAFDPNTATPQQLEALGLAPFQIRNILRYRSKGGVFQRREDFARLYGLTVKQYRELAPYIIIGEDYQPAAERYGSYGYQRSYGASSAYGASAGNSTSALAANGARDSLPVRHFKLKPSEHIDLNRADTTLLMRVPGIGSYFAKQIVRYRDRLGGFVTLAQLQEIEDFPTAALTYLRIDTPADKIKVNQESLAQLKHHPYLNYYQAKAITDYRRLHGPLHSLSEMRLLNDFTPQDIARLKNYVSFEP